MGEMRHMIGIQTSYRTQPHEKLYKRVYNNERARTYRDGDEKDEHRYIREEPSERKEDTEDGSGRSDGIQEARIMRERGGVIGGTHIR